MNRFDIAPEALALDLDDNIYRTSEAFVAVSSIAAREGLCDQATLSASRAEVEATGRTFDLDAFLLGRGVPEDEISELYDTFGAEPDPERFLFPDGLELITAIKQTQKPSFILTRGTPPRQRSKLRSVNLFDFAHIITDQMEKSGVIAATENAQGINVIEANVGANGLAVIRARGGTLVEDRPKGLVGLDGRRWNGVLVQRPGPIREAQKGNPPAGSIKMTSLRPITEQVLSGRLVGDMVRERLGAAA